MAKEPRNIALNELLEIASPWELQSSFGKLMREIQLHQDNPELKIAVSKEDKEVLYALWNYLERLNKP